MKGKVVTGSNYGFGRYGQRWIAIAILVILILFFIGFFAFYSNVGFGGGFDGFFW
ncbi:hypothetical protein [Thermoactinomyces mirandus]|uniref:Uncharacterized protein n=1 Tax=Thermoactinomyces mirandus TaxID=2756294 RepID=A0A7W1XR45_9BACL|nr:hypothetical protein [Thermoactinomyces mirandus]MBA4601666.1 hypothetical protein [Thermoactinomyces mirandus]